MSDPRRTVTGMLKVVDTALLNKQLHWVMDVINNLDKDSAYIERDKDLGYGLEELLSAIIIDLQEHGQCPLVSKKRAEMLMHITDYKE